MLSQKVLQQCGLVERMDEQRMAKRVMRSTVCGERVRDRTRFEWIGMVQNWPWISEKRLLKLQVRVYI